MKWYSGIGILCFLPLIAACSHSVKQTEGYDLAVRVRHDVQRSWDAYCRYAWGKDVLLPMEKTGLNWYEHSLGISPVDAFSTLAITGLTGEADSVVEYVADSLSFDIDQDVKVFEVNIRVLGGLVSMYQLTGDERILEKARDFGNRLLPAFGSATGIPYYWVNLSTGKVHGKEVNVAEAGTYLLEMGMLSYFTGDPVFYRSARRASAAIFDRRSGLGLVGGVIDVETGEWTDRTSHICAGTDSYYEYLYKAWALFGDPEVKAMWDASIVAVLEYLPVEKDGRIWYGRVDMDTGEPVSSVVTLYDAFFPAILALSGHLEEAVQLQETWDWLWHRNGIEPMVYDFGKDSVLNPQYALNPEIIESAWYLWELTGQERYREMSRGYYKDLREFCSTDMAFTSLESVITKKKRDYMPTFFLAETLKYLYLTFSDQRMYHPGTVVFNTEAHPYLKAALDPEQIRKNLGIG
jgi:hypothetical protein